MTSPARHPAHLLLALNCALLLSACSGSRSPAATGDILAAATADAPSHAAGSSTPTPLARTAAADGVDGSSQLAKETALTTKATGPSSARPLPPVNSALLDNCHAPRSIHIAKAARRMELHCGDEVAARFGVSLGFAPSGHKHHEGDGRTPEGSYYITSKFRSQFHRSLELSYPNIADAERGLAEGQISQVQRNHIVRAIKGCQRPPQTTPLGSLLQIHGGGGGEGVNDWTLGCVATGNPAIEAVYAFQQPGCNADGSPRTPVIITP